MKSLVNHRFLLLTPTYLNQILKVSGRYILMEILILFSEPYTLQDISAN
jgi:hypothetical protein